MPRLSLKSRQVFAIGVLLGGWIGFGLARLATGESDDLVLRIEPIATPAVAVVYVRGAVARPGLYTLPADARVAHAVERAGPRSDADLARVSMAERVRDGQTIDVPAVGQPAEDTPTAVGLGATDVGASPEEGSRKIDVNRASAAELERLPGVGPALAERIVAYRERYGPFQSSHDLARVPGISERMVAEWADLITVGSEE